MINYDLPWNPVRLEQRMGRIHRIGQDSKCVIFNFCAENTVEGKLLARLHEKLEEMRDARGGRVYDVIGDLLARNDVDFEKLCAKQCCIPSASTSPSARSKQSAPRSRRITRRCWAWPRRLRSTST